MKKSSFVLLILLGFSHLVHASREGDLIIEQIKASLVQDFHLKGGEYVSYVDEEKEVVETKKINTKLEQQLAHNRKILQERQGLSSTDILSGAEKIEMMKKLNREKIKAIQERRQNEFSKEDGDPLANKANEWMNQKLDEQDEWIEKKQAILSRWSEDRIRFKKEIPNYKKNLTPISDEEIKYVNVTKKIVVKKEVRTTIPPLRDITYVPGSLEIAIKNQGRRSTCAAFAGIRAIEILAEKKGMKESLSEQFFYWASKPQCQSKPCSKRGSWVSPALHISYNSLVPNIPFEKDCPYVESESSGNETQTPLEKGCARGRVRVSDFQTLKGLDAAVEAVQRGYPVIGGFKLSENFYENKGYVFAKDANRMGSDSHASGHAVLLVGVMALPEKLHSNEGKFCLLIANSWGEGWGRGGHACLSERWARTYQFPDNFVAIKEVEI